jgi:hypothetical protein
VEKGAQPVSHKYSVTSFINSVEFVKEHPMEELPLEEGLPDVGTPLKIMGGDGAHGVPGGAVCGGFAPGRCTPMVVVPLEALGEQPMEELPPIEEPPDIVRPLEIWREQPVNELP